MKYKKKYGFISIEIIIIGCIVIAAGFYAVSSGEKKSASVIKTLDHAVTQVNDTQNGKTYIDDEIAQGEHGNYIYEDGVATQRKITINVYQQNIYKNNSPAKTNMTEYKTTSYTAENFTKTETTYKFIDINQKDWTNDLSYTGFMFAKQEKTDDYEYDVYFHRERYSYFINDSNIALYTSQGKIGCYWWIPLDVGYLASKGKATTGDLDVIFHKYPLTNLEIYIDDVLWLTQPYWADGNGIDPETLYYGQTYRIDYTVSEGFEVISSSIDTKVIDGSRFNIDWSIRALDGYPGSFELYTIS